MPNYNLREPAYDGWWMPRWAWHVFRMLISALTAVAVYCTPHLHLHNAWVASSVAAVLTGLVPHIIGVSFRFYVFNGLDWCADFAFACFPVMVVAVWHGWLVALVIYALTYWALYPDASP